MLITRLSHQVTLPAAALVCAALFLTSAPAPSDEPKSTDKAAREGYQIDFSSLPGREGKKDYHLNVKMFIGNKSHTAGSYNIVAGTSQEGVRDLIKVSFEGTGWRLKALGKTVLVVEGYGAGDKFAPVTKVDVHSPDLPATHQAKVSRIFKK